MLAGDTTVVRRNRTNSELFLFNGHPFKNNQRSRLSQLGAVSINPLLRPAGTKQPQHSPVVCSIVRANALRSKGFRRTGKPCPSLSRPDIRSVLTSLRIRRTCSASSIPLTTGMLTSVTRVSMDGSSTSLVKASAADLAVTTVQPIISNICEWVSRTSGSSSTTKIVLGKRFSRRTVLPRSRLTADAFFFQKQHCRVDGVPRSCWKRLVMNSPHRFSRPHHRRAIMVHHLQPEAPAGPTTGQSLQ